MTGTPDPAALSGLTLFRVLSSEQLEKLSPLLHEQTFPAAANLITAEQPGEGAYVILSGSVKVYVTHTDGSEMILAILDSAQGGETGGYRKMRRSGEDQPEAWEELVGWIEEQGEEDTQGFVVRTS